MKKYVFALLTLFAVVVFFGCSGQKNTERKLDIHEGVLTEQNKSDVQKGTHFIVEDDGIKVAIRSLTINLSDSEYLNNKVQVVGFLNDKDGVFEATGVTVLEVLTENASKRKLMNYLNVNLGFALKYYDDWKVKEYQNSVIFTGPNTSGVSGEVSQVSISRVVFNYVPEREQNDVTALKKYFGTMNADLDISKFLQKVGPDGINAVAANSQSEFEYTLYNSGFIYTIKFSPQGSQNSDDELAFKEMLSEFKFSSTKTEAVVTGNLPELGLDLTMFESLPYHFKGAYPASWYYAGSKSSDSKILHHYGFAREALTGKNEILSLDVMAGSIPTGKKVSVAGRVMNEVDPSDGKYLIYFSVDGQNFRLTGPLEYKDLILVMASKIVLTPGP